MGRQRDRVYMVVRDSLEPLDAPVIAQTLGIHITTARFHLNGLIDEGLVAGTWLASESVGRPRKGYVAVGIDPIAPVLAALLAQLGGTADERGKKAAAAGRAWAESLPRYPVVAGTVPDPVTVISALLARLGFQVSSTMSGFSTHEIRMCNCPLRRIAGNFPEIVVGIQQGLIERALELVCPELASQYVVKVSPDTGGDCEVTLHLTGRSLPSASASN